MNFCNPKWNDGGELSEGDAAKVQALYGTPRSHVAGK
jgi:hypothetical protein